MLFSLLKPYLELYITDTALKVSQFLYCFTTSISHDIENYFPIQWGTGISDAIFLYCHAYIFCQRGWFITIFSACLQKEHFSVLQYSIFCIFFFLPICFNECLACLNISDLYLFCVWGVSLFFGHWP